MVMVIVSYVEIKNDKGFKFNVNNSFYFELSDSFF